MTQTLLNRSVARATGESRRTIARYGFSLLDDDSQPTPDDVSIVLECGGCGRIVPLAHRQYHASQPEAECSHCDAVYPVTTDELFAMDASVDQLARCA